LRLNRRALNSVSVSAFRKVARGVRQLQVLHHGATTAGTGHQVVDFHLRVKRVPADSAAFTIAGSQFAPDSFTPTQGAHFCCAFLTLLQLLCYLRPRASCLVPTSTGTVRSAQLLPAVSYPELIAASFAFTHRHAKSLGQSKNAPYTSVSFQAVEVALLHERSRGVRAAALINL
jgi:hypothetical protein